MWALRDHCKGFGFYSAKEGELSEAFVKNNWRELCFSVGNLVILQKPGLPVVVLISAKSSHCISGGLGQKLGVILGACLSLTSCVHLSADSLDFTFPIHPSSLLPAASSLV